MKIANNIIALQSNLRLFATEKKIISSSARLNSGSKINSSKDDPAGLAIGNKMKSDLARLEMASRNTLDAISLSQTAEGGLNEIQAIIQRMRELGVQSANGTMTDDDRAKITIEIDELKNEINSMAEKTNFNGISLLNSQQMPDPSTGIVDYPTLKIQIGEKKDMEMTIKLCNVNTDVLGLDVTDYSTDVKSSEAIEACDKALAQISEMRTNFGAYQNRLEYTSNNLDIMVDNGRTSLSRIMDTNMATEMTFYTQQTVISQAATSILAQANQRPQQILQLLG